MTRAPKGYVVHPLTVDALLGPRHRLDSLGSRPDSWRGLCGKRR
jgi:hypothetical protein